MQTEKPAAQATQSLIKLPPSPSTVRKIWLSKFDVTKVEFLEILRELRMSTKGSELLPGNQTADIELMEGGLRKTPADFEHGGELAIGARDGLFQDLETTRRLLEIVPDKGLTKIGAAIKRTRGDKGRRTELTRLLETLGDVIKLENVARDGVRILNYLHHGCNRRRVSKDDDGTLGEYLEELCAPQGDQPARFTDERAIATMRKLVGESVMNKHNSILELAYIKDCLVGAEGPKDARRVVGNLLCALYESEVSYWEAVDLCKTAKKFPIPFAVKERGAMGKVAKGEEGKDKYRKEPMFVNAVFIQTDNLAIPRASHCKEEVGDIGIVVIRNSLGNMGIYVDNRLPKEINDDVNLVALWKMVQSLELMAGGIDPASIVWDDLPKRQAHPDVAEYWRFVPQCRQILNGLKQGDVPSTRIVNRNGIGTDKLLVALECAFHLFYIGNWKRKQGIPHQSNGRKGKGNRPAPGAKPEDAQAAASASSVGCPAEPQGVAGTNDLEEAFERAAFAERSKKASAPKGDEAPVAG